MRHLPEDIMEALKIIKNTCAEQEDCYYCPFSSGKRSGNGCLINELTPNEWCVTDNPPEPWRAIQC